MKTIAFTPGEPAGIGIDLAVLNAHQPHTNRLLLFTDPDVVLTRAKKLGVTIRLIETDQVHNKGDIAIYPVKTNAPVVAGELNVNNAPFVLKTLDLAINACLNQSCSGLLTGPVHKGIINEAGVVFSGHTEYLAAKTHTQKTVMMLACDRLKVALATTHIPLSRVNTSITQESLTQTLGIIDAHFKRYYRKHPKVLVCGLNPHAGEQGYLGDEEITTITPVITALNKQGMNLIGPVAADTAFTQQALAGIDLVLAMYHDQGLTPLKTLCFEKAANITLGLPFIRASVDHGTALTLAATGGVKLGSLQTALSYLNNYLQQH